MKSAEVYRYQIQRLVDDTGSGRLSALSNYEPWNGKPGHHPKPYPLFDSAKDAGLSFAESGSLLDGSGTPSMRTDRLDGPQEPARL